MLYMLPVSLYFQTVMVLLRQFVKVSRRG